MKFNSIISIVETNLSRKDPLWRFPEEKLEFKLSELYEKGKRYSAVLQARGIGPGDTVGLLLPNSAEYVALLSGIWYLGAVAVPLRPISGMFFDYDSYLSQVQENCRFATIIFSNDTDKSVFDSWQQHSGRAGYLLRDITDADPGKVSVTRYDAAPDELAVIQYSSGSTGKPKGVMVSHQMVIEQLRILNDGNNCRLGQDRLQSSASWLPFNHDMGLFIGIMQPLYLGIDNLLSSPRYFVFKPTRWYLLLAEFKVNLMFTTNTAMASTLSIAAKLDLSADLSNLYIWFGAEKISPIVLEHSYSTFAKYGMGPGNFLIGYGMAENTLGVTGTRTGTIKVLTATVDENNKVQLVPPGTTGSVGYVSCGIPGRGTTVRICNEKDRELEELVLGEIGVYSPCLMEGYYRNEEASVRALRGGMLRSNDLGFLYQGELYFHSRKDDLIIAGGKNIVPDDIELSVENFDFVKSGGSVLISTENDTGECILQLLVEHKPAENDELEQHRKLLQQHIHKTSGILLNRITFCIRGTIETTSSGKKRRKVIRERFINGEVSIVGS